METLKILQIYETGPRGSSYSTEGVGSVALEMSKRMVKLGHEATFLTGASKGAPKTEDIEGVEIQRVDFLGSQKATWDPTHLTFLRQLLFPFAVLKKFFDMKHFDIYHGHVYGAGLVALSLGRLLRGKVVNTIHGSYYPIWDEIAPNRLEAKYYKSMEKVLALYLAMMCDVQIHTAKYFAKLVCDWGAPSDKLRVIENGVDIDRFNPVVKPGWKPQCCERMIFTARRLVRKNGLEFLIEAMPEIRKEHSAHLVIAGDGPERKRLMRMTRDLGVSKHITFLGLTPNERIPGLLAASAFAALPSLIEAPGLFLLEAMAMAKPIIATKVGSIPDTVRNMDDGILVQPRNAKEIARAANTLLDDKNLLHKLGANAREKVEKKYSWETITKEVLHVYEQTLSR